jgi:hypothetical protein
LRIESYLEIQKTSSVEKYLLEEISRQDKIKERYNKLKDKFPGMSKEWWFETHGIEL